MSKRKGFSKKDAAAISQLASATAHTMPMLAYYFSSPFDMVAKSRAFLVVTFDVTSGKPIFKDAHVTTQHPKPAFGLLHILSIKCKATSPGIAIRQIYRIIEREECWAWVRPYLKVKR